MTTNDLYFLEKHAQEPAAETRDIKITVSCSGQGLSLCYTLAQCLSQPQGINNDNPSLSNTMKHLLGTKNYLKFIPTLGNYSVNSNYL